VATILFFNHCKLSDQEIRIQTIKWFVPTKFSVANAPTGKMEVTTFFIKV